MRLSNAVVLAALNHTVLLFVLQVLLEMITGMRAYDEHRKPHADLVRLFPGRLTVHVHCNGLLLP